MNDRQRQLWGSVEALLDRAPSTADLRAHRLHLLAVARDRQRGAAVPISLALSEVVALQQVMATRAALEDLPNHFDGRILVLKGLSIGVHYPEEHLRPAGDVDLLTDRPGSLQAALVAAGWTPVGPFDEAYYDGLHHLRPLAAPGGTGPLVEVHRRPNWVRWRRSPPVEELLEAGVSGALGIDGILSLDPAHGAVVAAAHAWGEMPLRTVGDLIDITALRLATSSDEVAAVARRWGLERLWRTTRRAADGLLGFGPGPVTLRSWARNLEEVRDHMVFEAHIRRYCGPFWARPLGPALLSAAEEALNDVRRTPDETWSNKARRWREALKHPTRPMSEHKALLGPEGIQPRHRRIPGPPDA
jgi:hypothetical protein